MVGQAAPSFTLCLEGAGSGPLRKEHRERGVLGSLGSFLAVCCLIAAYLGWT